MVYQKKRRSGQKDRINGSNNSNNNNVNNIRSPTRVTSDNNINNNNDNNRDRDRARDPGRSSGTSSSTVYSYSQFPTNQSPNQKRRSNPFREFTSRFSPIPARTNSPDDNSTNILSRSITPVVLSNGIAYDETRIYRGRAGSDANIGQSLPLDIMTTSKEGIMNHILQIHQLLRGGLFQGMELNIPTCFIITNQLLDPNHISYKTFLKYSSYEEKDGDLDSIPGINGNSVIDGREPDISSSFLIPRIQSAQRWFNYLTLISNAISSDRGVSMITEAINGICTETELYFYLIDELTMLPVITSPLLSRTSPSLSSSVHYPIRILQPFDIIPKILPLMKSSLMAIASLNNIHLFGVALGFPPTHFPPELRTYFATEYSSDLDITLEIPKLLQEAGFLKKSSAISIGVGNINGNESPIERQRTPTTTVLSTEKSSWSRRLSYKMFGEGSENRGFEGHPLQELAKFYCEYDPQSVYCDLKRILLHNNSQVWTTKENITNFGLVNIVSNNDDDNDDNQNEEKIEPFTTKKIESRISLDEQFLVSQNRNSGSDCGDNLSGIPISSIGRTKSGRLITTVELNQNILLVQKELLKLRMSIEENGSLHHTINPSKYRDEKNNEIKNTNNEMESCGCILS
mmetsp:Transcript_4685/g.4716  ORF Transcript_4685/g.4716 Transcript_4685/m.4716 type:complete len:630 (-) Transcript_4685:405-2294(-)